MDAVDRWWTDVRLLVAESLRVWWRLLPRLLTYAIGGWLGYQLSLQAAGRLAARWPWLAMAVFALGFVSTLAAAVVSLRVAGEELGVPGLVAAEASASATGPDADGPASLTRVLALTLLPFLGIYAAFGYTDDRAVAMLALDYGRTAGLSDDLMIRLDPLASDRAAATVLGIVVGAYLLRRALDALHDRLGWRALGIFVAACEAFFLLTAIFAGQRLFAYLTSWVRTRRVAGWVRDALASLDGLLHALRLPEAWGFVTGTLWPPLAEILVEPVVWLALTALVLGSRVLSVADLWRQGHSTHGGRLARIRENRGLRRAVLETSEAFFGDIDDKYLPTLHSLRLILRAGLAFLAAYVLVYAVVAGAAELATAGLRMFVGGHDFAFWASFDPVLGFVDAVAVEPLRLVLLAVAFRRCLRRLDVPAAGRLRPDYVAGVAAVTALSLAVAGAVRAGLGAVPDYQPLRAGVGVPVSMADGAIVTVRRVDVAAATSTGEPSTGVYVQVSGSIAAPGPRVEKFHSARLVGDRAEFLAMVRGATRPGFEADFSAIYEVGPDHLPGLVFEYWTPGKITQYHQRVVVDLGIDEARAAELLAGARGVRLPPAAEGERPLR